MLAESLSFYLNSLRAAPQARAASSLPHPALILLPGFFPPRDPSVTPFPRLLVAWRAGSGGLCCDALLCLDADRLCLFPRRCLCRAGTVGAETQAP